MKKVTLTIALILSVAISSFAQSQYKLYAGFIYHFTKYVQWPSGSGDFVVGYVGGADVAAGLQDIVGKTTASGRKIIIKKINTAAELSGVEVLFVSKTGSTQLATLKNIAQSNNTLIVSEGAGMGHKGSIINFVESGGKLIFELKESEATKHGLKVSGELKKLAVLI